MLGLNKKKDTTQKNTSMPSSGNHSINSLVKGTSLEGSISCDNDIRIDGSIKGNLNCQSKVIIGPSGFVDGQIICENALIEGKIVGDLTVRGLLHIRETADITGDIVTSKLIVDPGAIINVSCNMSSQSTGSSSTPSANKAKAAE